MRVLVARPAADAARTARRLEAMGHAPLVAPVLAIVPTGLPPPEAEVDALVVTSRNAAAILAAHRSRVSGVPVFAVGTGTGDALAAAGLGPVSAETGDAHALADRIRATLPRGSRLLHVAGRDRRPEPQARLEAAGYAVSVWEAYAAEPEAALPRIAAEALATGALDAVLHYSARSAAILHGLVVEAGLDAPFRRLLHACLSRPVALALAGRGEGIARVAVATAPDEERLLALLGDGTAREATRPD